MVALGSDLAIDSLPPFKGPEGRLVPCLWARRGDQTDGPKNVRLLDTASGTRVRVPIGVLGLSAS